MHAAIERPTAPAVAQPLEPNGTPEQPLAPADLERLGRVVGNMLAEQPLGTALTSVTALERALDDTSD